MGASDVGDGHHRHCSRTSWEELDTVICAKLQTDLP